MRKSGFTLIELLIVIMIVGILAGAMVPIINVSRQEARNAKARADLDAIKTASVLLHHDTGEWPPIGTDGDDLISDVSGNAGWEGPYIDEWRDDPWGSPYEIWDSSATDRWVSSWGPDNADDNGGDDDINLILTPSH